MRTVQSKDGTQIAFWRSGEGPALLLVHGATADHTTTWRSVLPELERRFTVHAMDRRGRGGSGDAAAYDLQREAEDVAVVVDAIGGDVDVVGHSHGALCALEAALLTRNVRRLVLYEGVPLDGARDFEPGVLDRMDAGLAAGDVEGVLLTLLREVASMPPEDIEVLRSQRAAWSVRIANARSIPRELRAYQRYRFTPARFTTMRASTLLLVGGDSPAHELENARGIAASLPRGEVALLPGQQYTCMHTAPELFVNELTRFLAAH